MARKIKQGQTVYLINLNLQKGRFAKPTIDTYFIHSDKVGLPPLGCIIQKMPSGLINKLIHIEPSIKYFTSRRKAATYRNQVEHYLMSGDRHA